MSNYENADLREIARLLPCQNCRAEDGTVCAAHSNQSEHGKGNHLKAHDAFHAALCNKCHTWLDHGSVGADPTGIYQPTRADKVEMFNRAMHRTYLTYWQRGLIVVVR